MIEYIYQAYGDSLPYSLCKRLVKSGCPNINILTNTSGDTLLHRAVRENDLATVQILVEVNDVNLNAMNRNGETPIYLALWNYFEKVIYFRSLNIYIQIDMFTLTSGIHCLAEGRRRH